MPDVDHVAKVMDVQHYDALKLFLLLSAQDAKPNPQPKPTNQNQKYKSYIDVAISLFALLNVNVYVEDKQSHTCTTIIYKDGASGEAARGPDQNTSFHQSEQSFVASSSHVSEAKFKEFRHDH